jgi:hypothetical protein
MGNVHVLDRWRASVAVQVTVVLPIGNELPLAGVQLAVTGDVPLVTDGVPKTTDMLDPVTDTCVTGAGHVMVGSGTGGGGGVGCVGEEQLIAARALTNTQTPTALAEKCKRGK